MLRTSTVARSERHRLVAGAKANYRRAALSPRQRAGFSGGGSSRTSATAVSRSAAQPVACVSQSVGGMFYIIWHVERQKTVPGASDSESGGGLVQLNYESYPPAQVWRPVGSDWTQKAVLGLMRG